MSWVDIDLAACNSCGLCVLRCPGVFSKSEGKVSAGADAETCNLCGHCISLCPTGAINHHELNMAAFTKIEKPASIDPQTFMQFVRERRSHRVFKKEPIPTEELAKLVDICRYAPTGANMQNVEIILVQDREKIHKYADLTVDYFVTLAEPTREKLRALNAAGKENTDEYAEAKRTNDYATRLDQIRQAGLDPILYKAPAVMIFHSTARTIVPRDNGVIASTTVGLTARTLGLEFCYVGFLEMAANSYPPLFDALGLPADHKVLSVIVLGYSRWKYHRLVDRKPVKVRWE